MHATYFHEESANRDFSEEGFHKGNLKFSIKQESETRFNPARSFFRLRVRYVGLDGAGAQRRVVLKDDIAPSMFSCDALWSQIKVLANGVAIDEQEDYCTQIGALVKRMHYSDAWLEKQCNFRNFADPIPYNRQQQIASDAKYPNSDSKAYFKPSYLTTLQNTNFEVGADTIALTANTGTITFVDTNVTANFPLDIRNSPYIYAGAYIMADLGNGTGDRLYQIQTVPTALTMTVLPITGLADVGAGAGNLAGFHIRPAFEHGISDSQTSISQQDIELIYVPSLPFFREDQFLPPANYEIVFTPHANGKYQKYAVESIAHDVSANRGANNGWDFQVVDFKYYILKSAGGVMEDGSFGMRLDKINCQAEYINTNSLIQKTFPIEPSNHKITVAFQDTTVDSNTLLSPSKFKIDGDNEQKLSVYYIKKGTLTLPTPQPNIQYALPTQYLQQQYMEQMMYNDNAFQEGGHESFQRWLDRGIYLSQNFPMRGEKQVTVSTQFSSLVDNPSQINLLVFDHFINDIEFIVKNGVVVDVQVK